MRRTEAGYRDAVRDVWIWEYTLKPRRALNALANDEPRRGALLRIDGGFADVHPWPELGDLRLENQLELMARGELTALTARSLAFAEVDAAFRQAGRSAFEGLRVPASHFPAAAGAVPEEFDTVKVKCGPGFDPRSLDRWTGRRLRLDFNATLTAGQFSRLAPLLRVHQIDFVEDPCPYDPAVWAELSSECGLRLALDRGSAHDKASVMVIKPAVQDIGDFVAAGAPDRELVVTSYMDHAFGQICAAWVAAKYAGRLSPRCGLFTHLLYEPDAFFERIESRGAELLPAVGTGFGFDDLLQTLPWKKLS